MIAASPIPTAALEGRAFGALVSAGFGALWIVVATKLLNRLDWRAWLVVALLAGMLCLGAGKQLQVARHMTITPHSGSKTESDRPMGRQFGVVLALEWIAILGVVVVLARMRRSELILSAIAVIVGLHFVALGRIFSTPVFYFTAIAMVLTALAAFAIRDTTLRQAATCIGCGSALWLTSAFLLA
jgi:hypothetical protein